MCGITGFYHFEENRKASIEKLKQMTDVISHRGPDGEGFFIKDKIALGHRRLSIIDLDSGDQPMYDIDGNLVIVFNGEIYNYIELKNELSKFGHTFKTTSDTEVLLASYKQWGINCLDKLNGMWSFALYDIKCGKLFISRDRVGEKPLFYAVHDGTFVFSSEIKSIIAYGFPKIINQEVVELYMTLKYVPAPYSLYKGINKLQPGHYMIVQGESIREFKYWNLPEIDEENMLTDIDYICDEFKRLFQSAIEIRMRSDVPFGALLSGGLDSSSIVAGMSTISDYPIETFTAGFKEVSFDESNLASIMADKFNTNHHNLLLKPDIFEDSIAKVLSAFDEPFGDSSAIPTGGIAKECRKYVKMVLTGDGGDEVLSGYPAYQAVKFGDFYSRVPNLIHLMISKTLSVAQNSLSAQLRYDTSRLLRMLETSRLDFNDYMVARLSTNDISEIKKLLINHTSFMPIEDFISEAMSGCTYKDSFYKLMYLNFKSFLPDDYLTKVDRMTMANSLEARVPFLDHRLIEFMFKVHKNVKMKGFERKSVLRETYGKLLPKEYLKAPKKGFRIPLREWFKEPRIGANLQAYCNSSSVFDPETVRSIIAKNNSGIQDHGNTIWMMILLNRWVAI